MEQNLISHHSIGQNGRPKWLDKKRVLQVILLVTICMWLLNRVENSHHQHENYNENPQNPSSERNILIVLGRRGIQKYINGANAEFQDKNDPHEYERRDGGVGDDEIDGNINDEETVLELLQEENKVVNGGDEAIDVAAKSHGVAKQDTEMEKLDYVERVEAFLDENGIPPDASSFFNSTSLEQFHSRTSFSV